MQADVDDEAGPHVLRYRRILRRRFEYFRTLDISAPQHTSKYQLAGREGKDRD